MNEKMHKIIFLSVFAVMQIFAFAVPVQVDAWGSDVGGWGGDCCGGGFGGGDDSWGGWGDPPGDDSWSPPIPQTPAPSCTITVTPNEIYSDEGATISWTTSDATYAEISGIGAVSVGSGSLKVSNLSSDTTYTMTVTGPGGSGTCSVELKVNPVPECTLSASPSSVPYGGNSTLVWTSSNASSVTLLDYGSVGQNGSYTVSNLTESKVFKLEVKDDKGRTNTCETEVTVENVPAPSCSIHFTPSSVYYGGSSTLVWNTDNATSASISNIGSVALSGSHVISNITGTRTYTMTVSGPGGTNTCSATVQLYSNLSCNIYASPNPAQNNATTLYWTSSGASWATLSDGRGYLQNVTLNGSKFIDDLPAGSVRYTLTVGDGSMQKTCQVEVKTSNNYSSPVCSITADKTFVSPGQTVNLYWSSQNATSATLSEFGYVSLSGTKSVVVNNSKYYTLTVKGASGVENTCKVYISTSNAPVISVSSIPYTGPDELTYVAFMGFVSLLSFGILYSRRHRFLDLFK